MANLIEISIYSVFLVMSFGAVIIMYVANRRFLEGDFKKLFEWVFAATFAIFFGAMLIFFQLIFPAQYNIDIITAMTGFSFVVASVCLIGFSFILHDLSKVFGFAEGIGKFEKSMPAGKPPIKPVSLKAKRKPRKPAKRKPRKRH